MKLTFTVFFALLSSLSFASFNEVECEGKFDNKEIYFEVERPFPTTSVFKRAQLTVTEEGTQKVFDYTLTSRRNVGFNEINYIGGGVRLEVNTWPDNIPRWGRDYRGTLRAYDIGNDYIRNLTCRFPNAF